MVVDFVAIFVVKGDSVVFGVVGMVVEFVAIFVVKGDFVVVGVVGFAFELFAIFVVKGDSDVVVVVNDLLVVCDSDVLLSWALVDVSVDIPLVCCIMGSVDSVVVVE